MKNNNQIDPPEPRIVIGVSKLKRHRVSADGERLVPRWGEIYGHVASDRPAELLYVGSSLNGKESRRAVHARNHQERYWAVVTQRGATVLQIGLEHYLCLAPAPHAGGYPVSADLQGREHLLLRHAHYGIGHPVPGNRYGIDRYYKTGPNRCRHPELPLPDLSPDTVAALVCAQHGRPERSRAA